MFQTITKFPRKSLAWIWFGRAHVEVCMLLWANNARPRRQKEWHLTDAWEWDGVRAWSPTFLLTHAKTQVQETLTEILATNAFNSIKQELIKIWVLQNSSLSPQTAQPFLPATTLPDLHLTLPPPHIQHILELARLLDSRNGTAVRARKRRERNLCVDVEHGFGAAGRPDGERDVVRLCVFAAEGPVEGHF